LKVLIVGAGAREHTIAWKIAQSPKLTKLYAAPGNGGTAQVAENIPVKADDVEGLVKTAQELGIELVIVGPEAPLAAGLVDRLTAVGVPVFGPSAQAAMIETSKVFAKDLMQRHGIPCGKSASFDDFGAARDYLLENPVPVVVKADGLAAGKGVIICESRPEAIATLTDIMQVGVFGEAGKRVVIEEFMEGPEVSVFAISDGETVLPFGAACDYKRAHDGDMGPNTGGMGSYSPPQVADAALIAEIQKNVMEPVVRAMAAEGNPYRGVLFGGLMLTADGPKVLEFNARFGDPETQVILPRLKTDLLEVILAAVGNQLKDLKVDWEESACVGVVIASGGYPGDYETGHPVYGLDALDDALAFQAGTKVGDGPFPQSAGGRVATIVACGDDIAAARAKAYANIVKVGFVGSFYRRDIAEL
jgi:phosphoribosylamine---glycine ligase